MSPHKDPILTFEGQVEIGCQTKQGKDIAGGGETMYEGREECTNVARYG